MAEFHVNESNGGALVVTATIFLVLSWISVLLRSYVRALLTRSFQFDDWFMLVAQVIFTLSCSFILVGVKAGIGRHNVALPQDEEIPALMWQALATATYVLDMMFIKLSIGIFLLRLAVQKVYRYIIWTSLFVIVVWSSVLFFWDLFQCSPVEAQWNYTLPEFKCVTADQIVAAAYSLSIMTILSDWLYALLPVPMLWNVKMTKQAKLTVTVILGLGIFASIATLIRLRFLASLEDIDDILFAGTDAMVWTLVEPGVAIIASSLATIRPLLRAMRLKGFESTDHTGGTSGAARSGTNRSFRMAQLPHGDLEAQAIQHVEASSQNQPPRPHASPSPSDEFAKGGSRRRGSVTKSEMYIIEGDRLDASWPNNALASQSSSSVELDGVEAQSQHSGRVGLGGPRTIGLAR